MHKILVITLTPLLIAGCSDGAIIGTGKTTGYINRHRYNKECIGGVMYYENMKRLAPAFNRDGTLKPCDN